MKITTDFEIEEFPDEFLLNMIAPRRIEEALRFLQEHPRLCVQNLKSMLHKTDEILDKITTPWLLALREIISSRLYVLLMSDK